jgi:hypothetical protein
MTSDAELQRAYDAYFSLTAELAETDFTPLALAGIMAVQAFTLYKSCLTPDEYEQIMQTLFESRGQVKSITAPVLQ